MSRIDEAICAVHHIDKKSSEEKWLNRIHPLAKLLVTLSYIGLVISFNKYDFTGLLGMASYLIILMTGGEISLKQSLKQLKILLIFIVLVGLPNPFFDRTVIYTVASLKITGGMLSMITLIMKGSFALLAAYIFILITTVEDICSALKMIRVPKILITLIMLIHRYVIVLLKEVKHLSQAYLMRAPKQKGIHYKVWGTFLGLLLLRSIRRAEEVYESMVLRGFNSGFDLAPKQKVDLKSVLYTVILIGMMTTFRVLPVFKKIGKIFT